jgi:hypothetical protein
MNLNQANSGSPDLNVLVLEAWGAGLTGDQVINYLINQSNCSDEDAIAAVNFMHNTMKD